MKQAFFVFQAKDADPATWNASGDLERPGGYDIVIRLAMSLSSHGCICSEVYQRSFYGWELEIRNATGVAFAVLQETSEWLLVVEADEGELPTFVTAIKAAFGADNRITNLRVMRESEYTDYEKALGLS
jgi:hypothetical protein